MWEVIDAETEEQRQKRLVRPSAVVSRDGSLQPALQRPDTAQQCPRAPHAARHRYVLCGLRQSYATSRSIRKDKVEKQEVIKEIVKENKRPFYCELCDKQYRNHAARGSLRTRHP